MRWVWLAVGMVMAAAQAAEPVSRVAFGSCNRHDRPQPLWEPILAWKPQLWIWLGDNIYGDTTDMAELARKWRAQKAQPDYARLRAAARVLGTWDDHDYGANNAGREYPRRKASQALLLDFLDEPADSPRRRQAGVYASETFGPEGRRLLVVLLDVRFHREEPGAEAEADILGAAQWAWLERTLRGSRAEVRMIAGGSQFLPTEHRFDKWADYPRAKARLLALLAQTQTPGGATVLLSGDRHFGEISRLRTGALDVLEVTSSGLTHSQRDEGRDEPNGLRVGERLVALNFGTVQIDWAAGVLTAALRDERGRVRAATKMAFRPGR